MIRPKRWIDIVGNWILNVETVQYLGTKVSLPIKYGLSLNEGRLTQGTISTIINFPEKVTEARILFGYSSQHSNYYTAGIGGWGYGYTIQEFNPNLGWRALKVAGDISNLNKGKNYKVDVNIYGNRIKLFIDGIEILEHISVEPIQGDQIGLFSVGQEKIIFKDYQYSSEKADVFVVMQFSEPFNSLYLEVIKPVVESFDLNPYRSDDVYGPGIILRDIIKGIIESKIIIAEITPPNPNIFYELGFAHAIDKPTILLAEKGHSLPFDIQSYRVIFYEDSIKGKKKVEENLTKHLKAILNR
jgi:hypothetical protein